MVTHYTLTGHSLLMRYFVINHTGLTSSIFSTTEAWGVQGWHLSVISYYNNHGKKPVFSCFVDFSKAFDSVDRSALFYKLGTVGIKGNILIISIDIFCAWLLLFVYVTKTWLAIILKMMCDVNPVISDGNNNSERMS